MRAFWDIIRSRPEPSAAAVPEVAFAKEKLKDAISQQARVVAAVRDMARTLGLDLDSADAVTIFNETEARDILELVSLWRLVRAKVPPAERETFQTDLAAAMVRCAQRHGATEVTT